MQLFLIQYYYCSLKYVFLIIRHLIRQPSAATFPSQGKARKEFIALSCNVPSSKRSRKMAIGLPKHEAALAVDVVDSPEQPRDHISSR